MYGCRGEGDFGPVQYHGIEGMSLRVSIIEKTVVIQIIPGRVKWVWLVTTCTGDSTCMSRLHDSLAWGWSLTFDVQYRRSEGGGHALQTNITRTLKM